MAKAASIAPICASCDGPARLTNGLEIYPHRRDLHERNIWKCDRCGGYVGCHGNTTRALGTPANAQLRNARIHLHNQMVDPLWKTADQIGLYEPENKRAREIIRKAARNRVYAYLAHELGIGRDQCHVAMFDIDQCRKAWVILRGITYADVRAWWKTQDADTGKVAA